MPTEEGLPPRALLFLAAPLADGIVVADPVPKAVAYSEENSCWEFEGEPVNDELDEAISTHARNLGVEF